MSIPHQTRVLLVMTAQVALSSVFIIGYFLLVREFMKGNVHVPVDFKEAFIALIGVLTAGVGQILSYWFQRQREQTPPSGG